MGLHREIMSRTAVATAPLPQDRAASGLLGWAERGLIPDRLLRLGIRRLCAQRLRENEAGGLGAQAARYSNASSCSAAARSRSTPTR